jgi:hypothetical protein
MADPRLNANDFRGFEFESTCSIRQPAPHGTLYKVYVQNTRRTQSIIAAVDNTTINTLQKSPA